MIKLNLKRQILLKYQNGDSKSEIARESGACRTTVRKYINEYEETISKIKASVDGDNDTVDALVEELSTKPKYDSSNRSKRKLTDDMIDVINDCLEKNTEKLLNKNRKLMLNCIIKLN